MIFKPAARYPADPRAVFLLVLTVFTGLTALAVDAAPKTLNSVMPHWSVMTWGLLLVVGAVVTLVGMAYQSVNGVILEQVGSVMVGATTVFYSIVALKVTGVDSAQPIGIILAWGLACFVRWIQLQVLLVQANHTALVGQAVDKALEERDPS